jgi:hypothetical protein
MRADLLNDIRRTLGSALPPNLTLRSKGYDLYEAYVFTLVLRAARTTGFGVTYENRDGSAPSIFTFRTGPGEISSGNYSHAVLTFGSKPQLEAHVGIYISGVSKVPHEADVSVIMRDEAVFCRAVTPTVLPRYSSIILTTECKFHESSGIGISMGRGFMGLSKEFASRPSFFVMCREAARVKSLLAHHNEQWGATVVPGSPANVNRLVASFESVLENYKARR